MEEELAFIQQLKQGNTNAYHLLLNQYSKRVINTCYKFLLNQEDAEDIAQEVFVEVFQSIQHFRGEAKLSTWIYRIAVTKSLDEIKKRKRKKRLSDLGKTLHVEDVANWLAGGKPSDKDLHEKELFSEINAALNKLPDSQRIAYTLSKIDGYSNPEIAEIMGTTILSVESLIYRAKKKIGIELSQILKR